jgi:hypothetical protein
MRTIYLDLCCLNRPFDDQHQARVRLESEAVLGLVQLTRLGELTPIGSEVLDLESSQNPDTDRRRKVEAFLSAATSKVPHWALSAWHASSSCSSPVEAITRRSGIAFSAALPLTN